MIVFHAIENMEDPSFPLIGLMEAQQIPVKTIYRNTLYGYAMVGQYLGDLLPDHESIPQEVILENTESTFDYYYWKQLMENPKSFLMLTSLLYAEFLQGPSALILIKIENSPYRMSVVESLKGYINSMYGIDSKLVFDFDDMCVPEFYEDYSGFSREGIARYSNDLEAYLRMTGGFNDQSMEE